MDQDAPPIMSTRRLLVEISQRASLLIRKEVELARTEIKADLKAELAVVQGLALTLVVGIAAINMLLLAVVFALARVMSDWLAALAVAGGLIIIAGLVASISWQRRVTTPLALTRKTLREDVQWAKERLG
ncbi:MAG TPA: phage holin family protein [Methylomirabilota bacterium]|jgi:hypothetical protein